jgi:hypothetical protein
MKLKNINPNINKIFTLLKFKIKIQSLFTTGGPLQPLPSHPVQYEKQSDTQ